MLITNATLLTGNPEQPIINDGALAIEDGKISAVGTTSDLKRKYPDLKEYDASKKIVMPGSVNAHSHLYSALAAGMPPPAKHPENFIQVLERIWWRLDKALTPEDIHLSAMMGLMGSVKAGVTTIIDHHSSPNAISGSLSTIADAVNKIGARAVLAYEVSDRDGSDACSAAIRENTDFISSTHNEGRIAALFGLHASFTLSEDTLAAITEIANGGVGFHIHVAEDASDNRDSMRRFNKSVVRRLADAKILTKDSIAAHCVHVDNKDIKILKNAGVHVVHNPQSNENNSVGTAPIPEMIEAGISPALGTDSFTWDVLNDADFARGIHGDKVSTMQITEMLYENAKLASKLLGVTLGKLEAGAEADIVIRELPPMNKIISDNYADLLVSEMKNLKIDKVIIGGKVIFEDNIFSGVTEKFITDRAAEASKKLWSRMKWNK